MKIQLKSAAQETAPDNGVNGNGSQSPTGGTSAPVDTLSTGALTEVQWRSDALRPFPPPWTLDKHVSYFTYGNTVILNWGEIVPNGHFHNRMHIYPLGFKCIRQEVR